MPRIASIVVTWEADADEALVSKTATFLAGEGGIQSFVFRGQIAPVDLEWLYWLAESVEVYERERQKPDPMLRASDEDRDEETEP